MALTAWLGFGLPAGRAASAPLDPAVVSLLERSYFYGRNYFVLRSGRAEMILQTDHVDLAPAVLYLLFDAQDSRQSARKDRAFNFADGQGFVRSALEVVLGGFPFTALGHETVTRWVWVDGVPAVEASWWAGGLEVTEQFLALTGRDTFLRRIRLTSRNLAGPESIRLRLALPVGGATVRHGWLEETRNGARLGLGLGSAQPNQVVVSQGELDIGPIRLSPSETATVDTLLRVQIPATESPGSAWPVPAKAVADAALPALQWQPALAKTRASWAATSSITTRDHLVEDVYNKARFGLPAMVADNGVMDAGIFEYGAQWVRDTSNTLLGLVYAGQFELARAGFEHLLRDMVRADGATMIAGGFDDPDREQFDQMGELMHALKAYRDWTGDDSLIREHRAKLLAMVERPLRPEFRDATGMVHNRREFWERTFNDAYELAYQTYLVLGLRDAADLAGPLGATNEAPRWREEANQTLAAMLHNTQYALVADGHLIKRRSVTGQWVRQIHFPASAPDVPLKTESTHLAEPDATEALPIAFRLINPRSVLAQRTLDHLASLWNGRWFGGGYERYHSSGQCDQPGPWTFATCFILRAEHEAGRYAESRRALEWLDTQAGGHSGAWFEEIPLVRSQAPTAGILPWTSAELTLFVVRHWLGVRFVGNHLVLQPALYPNSPPVRANLRFRQGRLHLDIPGPGPYRWATVNGRRQACARDGSLRLPRSFTGGWIRFTVSPQPYRAPVRTSGRALNPRPH